MAKLFLVPTPIGNLEDMTFRAVKILQQVDCILAEDTRTSSKLLNHYQIKTPMQSYHMHNEHHILDRILQRILGGEQMALITDAGTPAISDPGFLVVRACIERGVDVECLPGATAFVPALVCSGLPNDRFIFEGFLPEKKGRQTKLKQIAEQDKTMIFYLSPHKVGKTLSDLCQYLGNDRKACLCRELTKLHEQILRGTLHELLSHFEKTTPKGEMVLVVQGKE